MVSIHLMEQSYSYAAVLNSVPSDVENSNP